MKKNPYQVYCSFLDEVIPLKVLSPEDEMILSTRVYKKLSSTKTKLSPYAYRRDICAEVVLDWPELFQSIADNVYSVRQSIPEMEMIQTCVKEIYNSLLDVYATLDLDTMLAKINSAQMNEDWSDYLRKVMLGLDEDEVAAEREAMGHPKTSKNRKHRIPSTLKELNALEVKLNKNVIGQEEAVRATVDAIKLISTGLAKFSSLFFVGPTGNGKTRLAKVLSDIYYKDRFFKVNCGEYGNAHEYAKLIGSPPGYIGHTEKSLLAEKAEKSNSWIFLFDEIEKAHPKFYDFLLNLLDEGTICDSNGKELDFSNSIFIFTSNKGMADNRIGHSRMGFSREVITYDNSKDIILESIKKSFSPEFLNRLDKTILFNQLDKEELLKVARLELNGIPVKKTKELLTYIIKNGYSSDYGARHLSKFIKNNIAILVADAVLNSVLPAKGNYYTCKVKDNKPYIKEMEE
jgi:ATP-dependent Clp protease ATP-binding subunit ClpA